MRAIQICFIDRSLRTSKQKWEGVKMGIFSLLTITDIAIIIAVWIIFSSVIYLVLRIVPWIKNWPRVVVVVVAALLVAVTPVAWVFVDLYCPVEVTEADVRPLLIEELLSKPRLYSENSHETFESQLREAQWAIVPKTPSGFWGPPNDYLASKFDVYVTLASGQEYFGYFDRCGRTIVAGSTSN